jgi:chromosome segregation ATPase
MKDLSHKYTDVSQQHEMLSQEYARMAEQLREQTQTQTQNQKKVDQALSEVKAQLDTIKEKTDSIIVENTQLAQQVAGLEEAVHGQSEQVLGLQATEKKLQESRDSLKKLLAGSAAQNKVAIEDLRRRNKEIERKSSEAVGGLQWEVDEIRANSVSIESEDAKKEKAELPKTVPALWVNEHEMAAKFNAIQYKSGSRKR